MVSSIYSVSEYRLIFDPENFTSKNILRPVRPQQKRFERPAWCFRLCISCLSHDSKALCKKNIKIYKKFTKLDFGQIFFENLENLKKSRKYFWNFSIENRIGNRKIKNFKKSQFFWFPIRFSMENFQKYFWDFRDFQNFWDFRDFGFCSKIKKFSTFFDDFFLKCFRIKSWLNNVATAMLFNRQKHNISKQTCSTKKGPQKNEFWLKSSFFEAIRSKVTKSAL